VHPSVHTPARAPTTTVIDQNRRWSAA